MEIAIFLFLIAGICFAGWLLYYGEQEEDKDQYPLTERKVGSLCLTREQLEKASNSDKSVDEMTNSDIIDKEE